jgi:hypothetical protein
MSWNEAEILAARRNILECSRAMLSGELSYIEGSRKIVSSWRSAKLDEWDSDFLPFVGIESETDALPLGKMRSYWNAAALEALQPEIDRLEVWAKNFGEPFCRNLIKRFGDGKWTTIANRNI